MPGPTLIDLEGERFGSWLVLRRGESDRLGRRRWVCRCDCGNERLVPSGNLRQGRSRQCRPCAARIAIAVACRRRKTLVRVPQAAPRCAARVVWDRIGDEVLDLAEQGVSRREIAIRFGLSKNAVVGWLNRNADLIGFHHRERGLLLPLDVPDHLAPERSRWLDR